jgi:hypothetical protein
MASLLQYFQFITMMSTKDSSIMDYGTGANNVGYYLPVKAV